MPRYVCIHGHFYQPPRENPWLETVELQESASPWHDWNARISSECYSRNAASRILDDRGDIRKICNNYSRMSFNIGPTLLTWLEEKDPLCYEAIIEADRIGRKKFSGHGPAMAQVYNHIIMPLASRRDKETQVKWGIADFRRRFNRMPEGMWLAECAVDTETLEVLAENGILFTVLSPWQAQYVKAIGWKSAQWQDVSGAKIDTTCAYRYNLPSGRSIALFFYDGVLSQKIAFGGLLNDGGAMARGLIDAHPDRGQPVLSHVATDGESYGHHHKHGDMALAYCLEAIDNSSDAQLTVYGEYLSYYPPESEVKLIEPSSWSCAHGVERWSDNCDCGLGTPGYHHKWRKPLRQAMNYLRDEMADLFEKGAAEIFVDAWNARNRYIDVILDRSDACVNAFLKQNATHELSESERIRALSLMEMQRNSLLMFTSCGWFFDEISRIEPVQIMRYSARAIELAKDLFSVDLEPSFLKILAEAPSNVPELQDGAKVYELLGKQGHSDPRQIAAYYGITSLLRDFRQDFSEGCWDMSGNALVLDSDGAKSFGAGKVHVHSHITGEDGSYLFAVRRNRHDGGSLLLCGISETDSMNALTLEEAQELRELFSREDNESELFSRFGYDQYTLTNIPSDARHKVLHEFLQQDVDRLEASMRNITRDYDQLMEYLTLLGSKPPSIIITAAEFTLTSSIVHQLEGDRPNIAGIRRDFEYASFWQVKPDEEQIRFAFADCINRILTGMCINGPIVDDVKALNELIGLFSENFSWHLSLYDAQNLYYELLKEYKPDLKNIPALYELGRLLKFSDELLSKAS